jgi:Siroheme synthase (precorrin-2 oxidase/ferrochelatase domain)
LLKTGAKVHLHSHDKLCKEVEVLLQQNLIKLIQANLEDLDLRNYKLIIATSDDFESNQSIAALAQKNNTPLNVVDQPELCSFLLPSIVDRSPLIVAVSSCGKSPTFPVLSVTKFQIFCLNPTAHLLPCWENSGTE